MSQRRRERTTTHKGRRRLLVGVVAATLICGLLTAAIQTAHATMIGITESRSVQVDQLLAPSPTRWTDQPTPVSVTTGTCKGVAVKPGSNSVKELGDTSGLTRLGKIQITPVASSVINLATRTATVFVPSGGDVITRFVNEPATGQFKICEVAGDPPILGQSFGFTESANGTTIGPTSVVAGTLNPLNCTDVASYQIGTAVNVAQQPQQPGQPLGDCIAGIYTSNITVVGGTATNVDLSAGTVTATVTGAVTEVIYTNIPLVAPCGGGIEVCVNAGDASVPVGTWTFTITPYGSNTPTGWVSALAGQCSGDIQLNAGQYTVAESFSPPDYVSSIATVPSGALLASDAAEGTATFAVAANNNTTAIFTNDTLSG